MARTRFAVALVLTACTALPAPALAHVTFTQDEITAIAPPSRDELRRTKDRLMAADAAIRDHINRSMHALMQGHSNGFALFDTWYRARDARLRDEAAQREVIANICGKALGLGLNVMFPTVGSIVEIINKEKECLRWRTASRRQRLAEDQTDYAFRLEWVMDNGSRCPSRWVPTDQPLHPCRPHARS